MRAEVKEVMRRMGVDEIARSTAERNRSTIFSILPIVISEFYDHLFSIGQQEFFGRTDVERLKSMQLEHWRRLFRVEFDDVYANHVTRIGIVHRDHGITPKVYMQSYGWFTSRLVERLVSHPDVDAADRAPLASAVLKLVFLDMTVALASYDAALLD